jgi:adenylate kinase
VVFNAPLVPDKCDKCSGELFQRADDREETVKKRLDVYAAQTKPLIEYYQDQGLYTEVDGRQEIAKVLDDIVVSLRGA